MPTWSWRLAASRPSTRCWPRSRDIGARAITVPTDITDADACARLMAAGVEEFGGIDVLVNNAFRFDAFQSFEDVDLGIWRKIMDTNLFGSLQMTRAALPAMRARGGGSVVMVASMVTRQPQPAQGGYAISKGALLTATRVLAYELGPSNVRVNAVVPGWMAGPSVDIYVDMTSKGRGVPAQDVIDELNARVPLGRIPSDRDVAGSIVYLASDLSSADDGAGARHQRRRDLRLIRPRPDVGDGLRDLRRRWRCMSGDPRVGALRPSASAPGRHRSSRFWRCWSSS